MKLKRLISGVSAAAMFASCFTAMNIASASTDVLWSDTFNSYENVAEPNNTAIGDLVLVQSLTTPAAYTGISGITLNTCTRSSGDDSSYYVLNTKEGDATDKYLTTTVSRFSSQNRGGYIEFDETYSVTDGKDLVLAFDAMLTDDGDSTAYVAEMAVGNIIINATTAGVGYDEWHAYKIVVNASGSTLYVDGVEKSTSTDTTISTIKFNDSAQQGDAYKAADHPLGYPLVSLDNVVVYNADDGVNDTTPAAETKGEAATPAPTAEPVLPNDAVLPSDAVTSVNQSFDSLEAGTILNLNADTYAKEYTDAEGLVFSMGSRSGSNNESYTAITNYPSNTDNNVVEFYTNTFANAARGPKMEVADSAQITSADLTDYAVITQEVMLKENGTTDAVYYVLADDTVNSDSTYVSVAFGLTTGETAEYSDTSYNYTLYHVEPDVFNTLAVEIKYDSAHGNPVYMGYLNGEALTEDYVSTISNGDYKTLMNTYPTFVANIDKGDSTVYQETVYVDNVVAYTTASAYSDYYSGEVVDPTPTAAADVDYGDANGDGKIDGSDAVAIVDYVLGDAPAEWNEDNADANADGKIDGSDAVAVVDHVLDGSALGPQAATASLNSSDNPSVTIEDVSTDDSAMVLKFSLDGMPEDTTTLKGFQVNLALDTDYYDVDAVTETFNNILTGTGYSYNATNDTFVVIWVPTVAALRHTYEAGMELGTLTIPVKEGATGDATVKAVKALISSETSEGVTNNYNYSDGTIEVAEDNFEVVMVAAATPTPEPTVAPTDVPLSDQQIIVTDISEDESAVTYEFTLTGLPEDVTTLKGFQMNFKIDTNYYDVDAVTETFNNILMGTGYSYNTTNDTFVVIWVPTVAILRQAYTDGMSLGTLTFPVKEDATGDSEITAVKALISSESADGTTYNYNYSDGTIEVEEYALSVIWPGQEVPTPTPTVAPTDVPLADQRIIVTDISEDESAVTYEFTLTGLPEDVTTLKGFQMNFKIDTNYYDVDAVTETFNNILLGTGYSYNTTNDTFVVIWVPTVAILRQAYTDGMSLGTITFPVKADATGDSEITAVKALISSESADGTTYNYNYSDGTIEVEEYALAVIWPGQEVPTPTPDVTEAPTDEPTTAPTDEPTTAPTDEPTTLVVAVKDSAETLQDENIDSIADHVGISFNFYDENGDAVTDVTYGVDFEITTADGTALTEDEYNDLITNGIDKTTAAGLVINVYNTDLIKQASADLTVNPYSESLGTDDVIHLIITDIADEDAGCVTYKFVLDNLPEDTTTLKGFQINFTLDTDYYDVDAVTETFNEILLGTGCQYNTTNDTLVIIWVPTVAALRHTYEAGMELGTLTIPIKEGATGDSTITVVKALVESDSATTAKYEYSDGVTVDSIAVSTLGWSKTDAEHTVTGTLVTPTDPSATPTETPTVEPTTEPTTEPTDEPTDEPTSTPTSEPTATPTASPTSKPGSGSSGSSGSGSTGSGSTTASSTTSAGTTIASGVAMFPVKLNEQQQVSASTVTYSSTKSGTTFTVGVSIDGTARTLFSGFDPVMAKVPVDSSANNYNIVAVDASGTIQPRSYVSGSTMYFATKNTNTTFSVVQKDEVTYADVAHPWAQEAISALSNRNIVSGYGDGNFDPDANVTRAQFVKMIVSMFDVLDTTATNTFADVEADAWYTPYIATAAKLGITTGLDNGCFDPNAYITRQDMGTMLFRACDVLSVDMPAITAETTYLDDWAISDYARPAVYRLQQANMMSGVGDGWFDPTANTTRAQAAVAVYNAFVTSMTNSSWTF